MSDTRYVVETVYATSTGQAESRLQSLNTRMQHTEGVISRLRSAMRGMFTGVVGGAIGGAVIGGALRGLFAMSQSAEDARLAIAGMATATGVTGDINQGFLFAESTMDRIRRAAAALPGETEDYLTVFRTAFPQAVDAGMNAIDVSEMTNKFTAVATTFGVDAAQAGRDLSLLLRGRALGNVRSWSEFLQARVRKTAQEFNAMRPSERIQTLQTALASYDPMLREAQKTWSSISGTAKDNLKTVMRIAGAPLFTNAKNTLAGINDWFDRNRQVINSVATSFGALLSHGFDMAKARAELLFGSMRAFAQSDTFNRLAGVIVGTGRFASGVIRNHPAAVAGVAAGVAAGTPGLGLMAGGLSNMASQHAGATSFVLDQLTRTFEQLLSMVRPVVVLFEGLQITLGSLFAEILPGLSAGIAALMVGVSSAFRSFMAVANDALTQVRPALLNLAHSIGRVFETLGKVIGPILTVLGAAWGVIARTMLGMIIPAFNGIASALSFIFSHLAGLLDRIGIHIGRAATGVGPGSLAVPDLGPTDLGGRLQAALAGLASPGAANAAAQTARTNQPRAPATPGRTQINVRIEQTIHDASDPDRVLVDTRRAFWQALYHPVESPGVRVDH